MTLTKEQKAYCDSFYEDTDIDLAYFVDGADADNVDALEEYMQDNGAFDVEIIYYSNAMEYLSENDPSLRFSLDIAHDMGCTLENLNSETLASLHASENAREHFAGARDEIDELFYQSE